MKQISACTLDCTDGCSLVVNLESGRITEISGNPEHPFTEGFICAKVRRFHERLYHPDRITSPLLRVGSDWQLIDWETALSLCAEKIQTYRSEPRSILHIQGGANAGMLSRISRLFFTKLGAINAGGNLCNSAGREACMADFGAVDANVAKDLTHAGRIVNWGKDPSRSSVHMAALVRQARQRGARVCTVSAGGDSAQEFSDVVVPIRPGTDRFLAAALIRLLIEHDRINPDILEHTHGWHAFKECVLQHSVPELSSVCGVAVSDIDQLFEFYAQPDPVATLIGWGLQRYPHGGENVRFINAVAMLTGNIGRSGAGSYFTFHQSRSFNMDWAQENVGNSSETILMPTVGSDILQAQDPPVRMIWVTGSNVVNQAPDSRGVARAFEATEFKVVVDAFMNDTAERADLILPCALMLEKEDLTGSNLNNLVNYVRAVSSPPGNARSDHWILSQLGARLDPPVILPHEEECMRMTLDSPYLDVSLEQLRQRGFAWAKQPEIAFEGLKFAHPDEKYRFPAHLHPEPEPISGYSLRLLTLVRREAMHSQISPEEHDPLPTAWVSPDNPMLELIDLQKDVFLASPLGRLQVTLELDAMLQSEVVVYRRGDWMKLGGGINQLVEAELTDIGEGAPFYRQYVRLEN